MEIKKNIKPWQLLRITDAAKALNVTRLKIYCMIRDDELDYVMVSGSPIVVMNEKFNKAKGG